MTRTKHIYYYLIYLRVLGLDKVQKFKGLCFVLGRYTSIGLTVYTVEKNLESHHPMANSVPPWQ